VAFKARPEVTTDVWLTPPWILKRLGVFDLDPCAAPHPCPWLTAKKCYDITKGQNGLVLPWKGRVWLNPPYSNADPWVQKIAAHKSGIACLAVKCETKRWMEWIWPLASCIVMMAPRVMFMTSDGLQSLGITHQTALVAWSKRDAATLRRANFNGVLLENWKVVEGVKL
jgi:hypothetical protein